jgi:hypothetical protein
MSIVVEFEAADIKAFDTNKHKSNIELNSSYG